MQGAERPKSEDVRRSVCPHHGWLQLKVAQRGLLLYQSTSGINVTISFQINEKITPVSTPTSHLALENTEESVPLRKLTNCMMETSSHDLPRELLLSHKRVLHAGEKPELQRRLEKRRMEQNREHEQALQQPSDLEQELRKRQLKQQEYEKEEVKRRLDQDNIPEFVRVKEKLRHIQGQPLGHTVNSLRDLAFLEYGHIRSAEMEDLSYYNDEDLIELQEFNMTEVEYHQGVELPFSHIYLPLLYFLIFFTGVSGNIFVIMVMCSKGKSRRLVDTFVANLAIADLVFVFTLPFWAVSAGHHHRWDFGDTLCKLSSYAIAVNRFSNVFFLACMSVDRYLAVVRLLDFQFVRSRQGVQLTCTVVWASSLLLGIPSLVFRQVSQHNEDTLCVEDRESAVFLGLSLASLILAFLLPLSVILFCYGSILLKLRHHRVPGNVQAESRRQHSLRIVLVIVAAFVVSCLPFNIFKGVLIGSQALRSELSSDGHTFLSRALVLTSCLAFLNSCANPLIYLLLDRHFRQRARWLCFCGLHVERGPGRTQALQQGSGSSGTATAGRQQRQQRQERQHISSTATLAVSGHRRRVEEQEPRLHAHTSVLYEGVIQDQAFMKPGPFFGAIPLPVHEILEAPAPTADVKDASYRVGRGVVNHPGRWWNVRGSTEGAGGDRFDLTDVEREVRDDIGVDPVQPDHVQHQELRCAGERLFGRDGGDRRREAVNSIGIYGTVGLGLGPIGVWESSRGVEVNEYASGLHSKRSQLCGPRRDRVVGKFRGDGGPTLFNCGSEYTLALWKSHPGFICYGLCRVTSYIPETRQYRL
ncbi:hypothetical protein SKAU_G00103190 [Synaphobranchus kaupii]|uniref:G-protein coupled receptors family 1 profile domain-containing protein n=1 Tax=Synaphobranchus kaupii TaxID=118154 RepID=A0A9Q1J7M0_SYNKA|nr:hypothetical protein SKAU_G00103190 [Synaphobranchus kaupii]